LHLQVRAASRLAAIGALALGTTLSLAPLALASSAPSAANGAATAPKPAAERHHSGHAPRSHGPHPGRPARSRARLVVKRRVYELGASSHTMVRGTLLPRGRGRLVIVEGVIHRRWRALARTRTGANGHFRARVTLHGLGSVPLRVRFRGDRRARGARVRAGVLRSFRPTLASWYALYGSALACGGTLRSEQLGVANRTLPCGTRVTLRYRGREVTVPVIDRGPYVGGREWDLTGATARRLGFEGVGVVWSTR
jgi:hypothetical protein